MLTVLLASHLPSGDLKRLKRGHAIGLGGLSTNWKAKVKHDAGGAYLGLQMVLHNGVAE
jgi:hypothetical protein